MSHTPGPWRRNINARYPIYAGDAPNHRFIAYIMRWSGSVPEEEQEANLNLISAAPELLAVLSRCISKDGLFILDSDLAAARAVIAKAVVEG